MALPQQFEGRLALPVIAAPMFLASNPKMVIENCKAGIIGTFPAANQRTTAGFEQWVIEIKQALANFEQSSGKKAAPFGVNIIIHKTNSRVEADLAILIKHQVPLLITSLGAVAAVVDSVHSYGGVVFHDVTNAKHGKKAMQAGVDGLIGVCAGAGGHAGTMHPFALVQELRGFFDKTIILAGGISTGQEIAAARCLGADLVSMGTRFLATVECPINPEYKQMIIDSSAKDIVYTDAISGVPASFLTASLENAGYDINDLPEPDGFDIGAETSLDDHIKDGKVIAKPWKDLWSAGHGVSAIDCELTIAQLIDQLHSGYQQAKSILD